MKLPKRNFLKKVFLLLSLRNIVKNAGVTTGAFYGYYRSKEELFDALVDEAYQYLLGNYKAAAEGFEQLSPKEQMERMGSVGRECMQKMLVYMRTHPEAARLLLFCAEGTPYASLIDDLVEQEIQSTEHYGQMLREQEKTVPAIDQRLEHILVTGMVNVYFEIIRHNMSEEDSDRYLCELNDFYTAGWNKIMGQ